MPSGVEPHREPGGAVARQSPQRGRFQRWPAESLGISRRIGPEPFFASPAGALRLSRPSWRRRPPLARRDLCPFDDALHLRRRISSCPALCGAAPSRFSRDRPSIDMTVGVHSRLPRPFRSSRERSASFLGVFGAGLPSPARVPSSWFLTTPTACSTDGSWACCIPQPILGFIGFPRVAVCRRVIPLPLRCTTLQSFSTYKAASLSPGTIALLPLQMCVP
jgi:hypothetical protein